MHHLFPSIKYLYTLLPRFVVVVYMYILRSRYMYVYYEVDTSYMYILRSRYIRCIIDHECQTNRVRRERQREMRGGEEGGYCKRHPPSS